MDYPTELIAKAKYELQVFERVAMDTGEELVSEVERLRAALVELTRLDPPETERANVRVVVYGNDARNFALRALTPNV